VHISIPEVSQTWDTYSGVFSTMLAIAVTALWWHRMSVVDTQVYGQDAPAALIRGRYEARDRDDCQNQPMDDPDRGVRVPPGLVDRAGAKRVTARR
jgi:hypothetical protein